MSDRPAALNRRQSNRAERRNSAAPYEKPGSTGLTSALQNSTLDWDEKASTSTSVGKSLLSGWRKKGKDESKPKEERTTSFRRILRSGKHKAGEAGGSGSTGDESQKTVFISCSALLREVKLCVKGDVLAQVEDLLTKLGARDIPAEQAVKKLMELVGTTLVQQAGLSVMNLQKGVLPHGWLEYMDESSGRPYYYNVHNQVTTWHKPAGDPAPPPPQQDMEDDSDGINLTCAPDTHNVAMSGFI